MKNMVGLDLVNTAKDNTDCAFVIAQFHWSKRLLDRHYTIYY